MKTNTNKSDAVERVPTCRVVPAPGGRFALVQGATSLGELCCEATAMLFAAAVNNGPVRMTGAPRWGGLATEAKGATEMEDAA